MYTLRSRGLVFLVLLLVSVGHAPAFGQFGVSSASFSMSRAGLAPDPDAIRIEEFFNFHKHAIAKPKDDETIALDVRLAAVGDSAVLQVGLATHLAPSNEELPPLNIALVIDKSGSMSGDRIANVKKAILSFVERLRPTDRVAIVGFNQEADVILEGQKCTDTEQITEIVESINAGGSTNVHAGLILGYEQVKNGFDKKRTNRVILLTDGRTNSGVTDPEKIIADSVRYNKSGIDVSTIGLGHNLNHQLLRQLAKAGRGLIHFVDNDKDIQKIFVRELESLFSPVARKVNVKIEFGDQVRCERFYGYEPKRRKHAIDVPLDDLNHHSTQVLLAKFAPSNGRKFKKGSQIQVLLTFVDEKSGEPIEIKKKIKLPRRKSKAVDAEVQKNLAIADMAYSIKLMAVAHKAKEYSKSKKILNDSLCAVKELYPKIRDKDIKQVIGIVKNYKDSMDEFEEMAAELKAQEAKQKPKVKTKVKTKTVIQVKK